MLEKHNHIGRPLVSRRLLRNLEQTTQGTLTERVVLQFHGNEVAIAPVFRSGLVGAKTTL